MRLVALFVAALLPSLAFAATPSELWKEALAEPGTKELLSFSENGYRVDVTTAKATEVKGATVVRLSFARSEIDTEPDVPVFKKPRKVPQRPGLPAQVVITDAGVWVLSTPVKNGAIAKLLKSTPTFVTGATTGVVERPLRKGPVTCFTIPAPAKKKAAQPVELCLAPGAGIVALKGVAPDLGEILFAHLDWGPREE